MASITINTTPAQDAVIQRIVDKVNTERASQNPPLPALDISGYVQHILTEAFKSWKSQQDDEDVSSMKAAWASATPAERNQIRTILRMR